MIGPVAESWIAEPGGPACCESTACAGETPTNVNPAMRLVNRVMLSGLATPLQLFLQQLHCHGGVGDVLLGRQVQLRELLHLVDSLDIAPRSVPGRSVSERVPSGTAA